MPVSMNNIIRQFRYEEDPLDGVPGPSYTYDVDEDAYYNQHEYAEKELPASFIERYNELAWLHDLDILDIKIMNIYDEEDGTGRWDAVILLEGFEDESYELKYQNIKKIHIECERRFIGTADIELNLFTFLEDNLFCHELFNSRFIFIESSLITFLWRHLTPAIIQL